MEIQLKELIAQIRKDGVEAAEGQAEAILEAAKAEADKIVADAKAEAEKILLSAKTENERMVKSGEDALRQAGRNLLISFRESVTGELTALVRDRVTAVYSSDAFAGLLSKVLENWTNRPDAEDLTVLLNERDLRALEDTLLAGLTESMKAGVTLKPNDRFDGGFRVSVGDDGAYYDYSAEAVTEMLSAWLNPNVTALLKEAEGV